MKSTVFFAGARVRRVDAPHLALATVIEVNFHPKSGRSTVWIRYDDDPPHDETGYPHNDDDGRLEIIPATETKES